MKNIVISLLVLAVAGGASYYIIFRNLPSEEEYTHMENNEYTNKNMTTATTTNTPVSENVTVTIKNFSFNPKVLNIKTGTKVTWINNDSAPHTVTSDSGSLLNSPTLSSGSSFSFTFSSPTTVNYHCAIHPMMKASVIVTD